MKIPTLSQQTLWYVRAVAFVVAVLAVVVAPHSLTLGLLVGCVAGLTMVAADKDSPLAAPPPAPPAPPPTPTVSSLRADFDSTVIRKRSI